MQHDPTRHSLYLKRARGYAHLADAPLNPGLRAPRRARPLLHWRVGVDLIPRMSATVVSSTWLRRRRNALLLGSLAGKISMGSNPIARRQRSLARSERRYNRGVEDTLPTYPAVTSTRLSRAWSSSTSQIRSPWCAASRGSEAGRRAAHFDSDARLRPAAPRRVLGGFDFPRTWCTSAARTSPRCSRMISPDRMVQSACARRLDPQCVLAGRPIDKVFTRLARSAGSRHRRPSR